MERSYLQSVGLAIVALAAGLLVGAVGMHIFQIDDERVIETEPDPDTATAAAELRVQMNRAWGSTHYELARTMRSVHEIRPDTEVAEQSLADRNTDMASTLESVYAGEDSLDAAATSWEDYTTAWSEYAALEDGENGEQLNDAETAIESAALDYVESMADLTEDTLSAEALGEDLLDYNDSMQRSHDAWVAGNYEEADRSFYEAREQLLALVDTKAQAIVEHREEDF